MALPPSPQPRSAGNQLLPTHPPPPGSPGPDGPEHPTGHGSPGPGRAQPTPGPHARLLLFPLFLPPPSPIRIVCLNSTLTNMDSSGLGRAVITCPPPHTHTPGAGPPPPISTEFNAAPPWRGGRGCRKEGAVRFPVHTTLPTAPAAPGPQDQKFTPEGPSRGQ